MIVLIYINFIDIGEKYVTSSAFIPILKLLSDDILKEKEEDTTLTNDIRSYILADLSQRNLQTEVVELLQISSFIDPRFKLKYLDDDEAENAITQVCSDSVEILSQSTESSSSQSSAASATTNLQQPAKKRRTLGSLLKSDDTNDNATPLSPEQKAFNEIEKYKAEEPLDPDDDPLKWWKEHSKKYPILSRVCKKYLAIPATSSPSERLFSRAGNITTPLRNSLKPAKVDMLTFLATNAEPPK